VKWLQLVIDGLIPEEVRENRERSRQFRLIMFSVLILVPIGLLFTVQRLFIARRISPTVLSLFTITMITASLPFLARWMRSSFYPGVIFSLNLIGFIAFTAFYNGGIQAPALIWSPTVPLLAVLLVGPRTGMITAGLLVGLLWFYRHLAQIGYALPQTISQEKIEWIRFATSNSLIVFIALLAWYYETSRRKALALAQARLKETERLNQELRAANQKAEEASHAKSKFLAHINHELRTPLNGVIGVTSSLRQNSLTPSQEEQVETIHLCGENLLMLINGLLDLSKMEAGKFILEESVIELQQVIRDVTLLFKHPAEQKGLHFHSQVWQEEPIWIIGDPTRLRQVLINLLGNAVKFTEQGEVALRVRLLKEDIESYQLEMEISDTGIGIAPKVLKELFKPFVQADHSITREYGGSGLGLSICQELVGMMNGKIQVKSEMGKGSQFQLLFRFLKTDPPDFDDQEPSFRKKVERPKDDGREPASILVVEDNLVNQKVASLHLKTMGYQVYFAHNGREAVELCKTKRFDVILMDCEMPEMDGYTATQEIRSMEGNQQHTPIIALSAHTLESEVNRAYAAGMDAHLSKPFRAKELQAVLIDFLP